MTNTTKHAVPDHPILPLLAQRHSPYAFQPKSIERDKLLSCLEAARWAASSFNDQPWRFLLAVRDDQPTFNTMLSCLVEANQVWAKNTGALILTVASRTFAHNNKPNRVCEHDIGLAAANLTLQALSLGLHVHQMAGIDIDKIRKTYNIPAGYDPLTAIALGYAADPDSFPDTQLAQRDKAPRSRKPLSDWVFSSAFGSPSPLLSEI